MLDDALSVALGLVLLFAGGEALVRGAVAVADRLGVSKLIIGLVVVGFGTSAPELLVSVNAALGGTPEIALGNVIGSNIANVLLIVGTAAALVPIAGWQRSAVREAMVAVLVGLVLFALLQGQAITRLQGLAMLVVLAVYLMASYWLERRERQASIHEKEAAEFEEIAIDRPWLPPLLVLAGIAVLVLGADLLVEGATGMARAFGVSDAVIGLSLVALGTSLPELATAIVASLRRHADVVLGNVIGSSIFNVLAILGVTATLQPIGVDPRFRAFDSLVMLAALAVLGLLLAAVPRIGRLAGLAMLALYVIYIGVLFAGAGA